MKGYCNNCKKKVQGVKRPISWLAVILWLPFLLIGYIFWRTLFVFRDRCPICGLKLK